MKLVKSSLVLLFIGLVGGAFTLLMTFYIFVISAYESASYIWLIIVPLLLGSVTVALMVRSWNALHFRVSRPAAIVAWLGLVSAALAAVWS